MTGIWAAQAPTFGAGQAAAETVVDGSCAPQGVSYPRRRVA